ncbi:hypothetical protein FCM35_KLT17196 [Carex littledalei]|uniref:Protein kinase domain-containing protein n=1 Tax=Carex littledalei TaxID=544730 RepID=A0A833RQP3_9POAL|nr:hypothetical protein FCM35_KLT17196 [Carex littledalei]
MKISRQGLPILGSPRYYSSYQLSEKSDVFSFGVVILEIITGQPPIIAGPEGGHLKQWVNQKLSRGDIESIVDPRMHGHYDINSVWEVTDLACRCTDDSSPQRPTMSAVVKELEESLYLEISTERPSANFPSDVSVIEMPSIADTPESGPIAR